jgi:hypothetical protein
MVLMLCSSVHSIGSQMHNGRADLLFPTTHRTGAGQSSFVDGRGAPHGSAGFGIRRACPAASHAQKAADYLSGLQKPQAQAA